MMSSSSVVWLGMINDILTYGAEVNQNGREHEPRSRKTLELLANRTVWDMSFPLVLLKARKMSYKFAFAEALWILKGDNRLEPMATYASYLRNFSDDGLTLSGAYGPPFVDQAGYVVDCLTKDVNSRQAVVSLWRPRPGPSKDIPCTLSLQWMIRSLRLHCVATMRSSDAWLGVPYDVSTFSILSAAILIRLRKPDVKLGNLYLTAGSQHLYAIDHKPAEECLETTEEVVSNMSSFNDANFANVWELESHLDLMLQGKVSRSSGTWLSEVVTW